MNHRSSRTRDRDLSQTRQETSCDELKKAYDEGFRAGREIIAAEFRTQDRIEPTPCLETSDDKRNRYTRARGKRNHDPGT
jgi:hypothetical protein